MADILPGDEGRSLSGDDEALLRRLWGERSSIDNIAGALGISHRATEAWLDRLDLRNRRAPTLEGLMRDRGFELDRAGDPLLPVLGSSVKLEAILDLNWPDGVSYFDRASRQTIEQAALVARPNEAPLVTAAHLALAVVSVASNAKGSPLKKYLRILDAVMKNVETQRNRKGVHGAEILRWDAVEVLASAAHLRSRLYLRPEPIIPELLLLGFFYTPTGQEALIEVGLGDTNLAPFKEFALAAFDDRAARSAEMSEQVARQIHDEVQTGPRFQEAAAKRAGYASDAVDLRTIDPAIRGDARALADLILLEAAAPPLAIGIFGSWGSGKSTLLAALKHEIISQTANERAAIADGNADEDPATRRLAGVMQIDLNAWTFADSDNLWASLTSDIFEQIAAGGKDQAQAKVGAELVAEVAERTSKEAGILRAAQAALEEHQLARQIADRKLRQVERDEQMSAFDAAFAVMLDLLGTAGDKDEDKKDAEKDDKDDAKDKKAKDDKKGYIDVFRQAALLGDAEPEAKLQKYAEATSGFSRFVDMASDFVLGRSARSLGWIAGAITAGALTWYFGAAWLPSGPAWAVIGKPLVGLASTLGIAAVYLLPVFRVALLSAKKLREKREAAGAARMSALKDRNAADLAEADAKDRAERSSRILEKLGGTGDGGASPSLMLGYLLEDSSEIMKLRGTLGTLGTVRKAFEKLNTLVAAQDRASPVQRIVITIDDLDRCSERQVLQILEAIHLLLAFPCFVVIAAVDARWLSTALMNAHSQLASEGSEVTAADYLEKIFQIPYWVRPLKIDPEASDGGSYGRLIDELTMTWELDWTPEDEEAADYVAEEEDEALTPGALVPIAPHQIEADVAPRRERVSLDMPEIELFRALGVLASRSPRAVKRMINIYRLIRASAITDGDMLYATGPDGERVPAEYVQFALACEAGLPANTVAGVDYQLEIMTQTAWAKWKIALANDEAPVFEGAAAKWFDDKDLFRAFFTGLGATARVHGRDIDSKDLRNAFAIAGRFSFRRPTPIIPTSADARPLPRHK